MTSGGFRFDRFVLEPEDRRLRRDGESVELSGRYLDALALLVSERGRLVSKTRFMDEVWRGAPVTDEALTQCIKTLRKQLGDDATNPRFIETVPKHGYRFIAAVELDGDAASGPPAAPPAVPSASRWRRPAFVAAAGTAGGGLAGLLGVLFYAFGGVAQPTQPGMGAASVLLVLACLNLLVGLVGGAGVSAGVAAAGLDRRAPWSILGGALGGALVGGFGELLGQDAVNLLFGRSPGDITGAFEGALLGGAVGLAAWLGSRLPGPPERGIALAGAVGAVAGVVIVQFGGRLMTGSLDLVARGFPESRLQLGQIGGLFGEPGFGLLSQAATGGVEGALFVACVAGAMLLARRRLSGPGQGS